jgi:hypothetical protein
MEGLMATYYKAPTVNFFSTTLNGAIDDNDVSATLTSVSGLQAPGFLVIDRQDGAGNNTPSAREFVSFTTINGSAVAGLGRAADNSTARSHADGALVEATPTVGLWNDMLNEVEKATGDWVTDADGATVTFDLGTRSKHRVTLTDNRVLAVSNCNPGQAFLIELIQDAGGTNTVTWFTTIKWAAGTTPPLTSTGSKADLFGFIQTSTDNYLGFVVGQNL